MALLDPKDAKAPPANQPGEFTRLFGAPPVPAPENMGETEPPVTTKATPEIGPPTAKEQEVRALSVPADPIEAPSAAPGSLTAMFGLPASTPAGATRPDEEERPAPVARTEHTPAEEAAAAQLKRPPGDFTLMFSKLPKHDFPAPSTEVAPPVKMPEAPKRTPGAFTQLFSSLTQEGSEGSKRSSTTAETEPATPAAPVEVAGAEQSSPYAENQAAAAKTVGEFTKLFSAAVAGGTGVKDPAAFTKPPEAIPGPQNNPGRKEEEVESSFAPPPTPEKFSAPPSKQAGEFTKLFAEGPAPTPTAMPSPASEARQPGAFTRLFSAPATTPTPPPTAASEARQPGAFTKLFSATTPTAPSPPASEARQPGAFTKLFSAPAAAPGVPVEPSPQPVDDPLAAFAKPSGAPLAPTPAVAPPTSPGEPFVSSSSSGTGRPSSAATQIFSRPGAGAAAPAPPVPAGPSAFTRIVSAPQPAAPAVPPAAIPGLTPPAVPMPQMSPMQVPPISTPQMQMPPLQMPLMQMPQMQVPGMQMPGMQMPQTPMPPVPAPPPATPAPAGQVNWMPLIIGINVLFLLAIIVILIFALKK